MPKQYQEIPIDGGLNFLVGAGQRTHNELKNVYTKNGHLRRRNALVTAGPTSTPGTEGNVRLLAEFQHGDNPPTQLLYPISDDVANWTPSAGTDNYAMVDEVNADDDTTYLSVTSDALKDFYTFTTVAGFTSVDKLTFHLRGKLVDNGGADNCRLDVYVSDDSGVTSTFVGLTSNWTFAGGYVTKTIDISEDPLTSAPWTQTLLNTYSFGMKTGSVTGDIFRLTQYYITVTGTSAATRERSKIIISNTEFLRLEEDLSAFTDIDDTLASAASATQVWDTCEFDSLIWFTNDTDDFFKYPDAGSLLDQNATALEARTIAPFGDRLFAGNIEEGGTRFRSRLRWSVVGDGDDFAGAGSGNFDMDARPGEIVKLYPLAEKATTYTGVLAVYKDTSIYHVYATGVSADPFDYRLMDGSTGAVGTAALDSYSNPHTNNEVHAFVGKRNGELNVFTWNGSNIFAIGDPIKDDLNANANYVALPQTIVRFDPDTSLLWVGIPRDNETFPASFYTYDIIRQQWKEHVSGNVITALGQFKIASKPTLVAGKTDGLVLKEDTSTTVDTGQDVETLVTTGDFFLGDGVHQATISRIWLWYVERDAVTIDISISTDGGDSYAETDTVDLLGASAGKLNVAQADVLYTGRAFRIKLQEATDADIELVKMIVEWEPKSET